MWLLLLVVSLVLGQSWYTTFTLSEPSSMKSDSSESFSIPIFSASMSSQELYFIQNPLLSVIGRISVFIADAAKAELSSGTFDFVEFSFDSIAPNLTSYYMFSGGSRLSVGSVFLVRSCLSLSWL